MSKGGLESNKSEDHWSMLTRQTWSLKSAQLPCILTHAQGWCRFAWHTVPRAASVGP